MILMPIVYVTDMARSRQFYADLGFDPIIVGDWWSELRAGDGAVLALHRAGDEQLQPGNQVELALATLESLEHVSAALHRHNVSIVREITDEGFGRSLRIADPDGLTIQINEHRAALFGDGLTADGG
jgi:catechol 2,3-dioxygenase-like lactoylglutathione lyase family enzyme